MSERVGSTTSALGWGPSDGGSENSSVYSCLMHFVIESFIWIFYLAHVFVTTLSITSQLMVVNNLMDYTCLEIIMSSTYTNIVWVPLISEGLRFLWSQQIFWWLKLHETQRPLSTFLNTLRGRKKFWILQTLRGS